MSENIEQALLATTNTEPEEEPWFEIPIANVQKMQSKRTLLYKDHQIILSNGIPPLGSSGPEDAIHTIDMPMKIKEEPQQMAIDMPMKIKEESQMVIDMPMKITEESQMAIGMPMKIKEEPQILTDTDVPQEIKQKPQKAIHPIRCNFCENAYSNQSDLSQHVIDYHKIKGEPHSFTDMPIKIKEEPHTSTDIPIKIKEEQEPHSSLDTDTPQETKEKPHTSKHPIQCNFCENVYFHNSGLSRHIITYHKTKQFSCHGCKERFYTKQALFKHVHNKKHTKYVCDICDKQYKHLYSLSVHKQTHMGLKPLKCDICFKLFQKRKDLARHRNIHLEKIFSCKECGEKFHSQSALNTHNVSHNIILPYKCDQCSLCFGRKSSLAKHIEQHSVVFGQDSLPKNLTEQRITYTAKKSFGCDQCGKRFYQNSSLAEHLKLFHL